MFFCYSPYSVTFEVVVDPYHDAVLCITPKMKFSTKHLFSKCEPTENCGLFTFTKEIHNRKLHFLSSDDNKN